MGSFVLIVFGFMSKGTFYRPAVVIEAGIKRTALDPKFFSPLFNVQSFAVERYRAIRSAIIPLLNLRCPSAVRFRVAAIVIASIKSKFPRARSHVGVEVLKRIAPASAYFNPARTIPFVCRLFRIHASLDHIRPDIVLGSIAHPVSAMKSGLRSCGLNFLCKTSAASCSTIYERTSTYNGEVSTIAKAPPMGYLVPGFYKLHDHQSPVAFVSHVYSHAKEDSTD
jgi:hypothetical protein